MIDASLPFHQDDVGVPAPLQHQLLRGAGDEVGHHRVHRNPPALDHDSGLTRRHEAGAHASLVELPGELELRGHLADVAVGPHGEHHERLDRLGPPRGDGEAGGGRRRS